jgi:tetratricopeptide (TPR) repeat protein
MSFNKAKALKAASKYVQQGKYQSAIEEYRQIAEADPSDVTTLNTLGDLYVKVGQTSEAIHSFMHIADHYRNSGFYLKAIAMLKKVSKVAPNNVEISLLLAGLYAQQKLIVDARHQYLSVAEHYVREGNSQEALHIYQKIADLDPENTAIHVKLAEAYQRENQLDKSYDAFVVAAGELRRQNKEGEALQTYLRAIKVNPRGQAALSSSINIYLQSNRHAEAVQMLEELLAERPNDAEMLTLLSRVHQAAHNLEAAEECVNKMLECAPSRYQYAADLILAFVRREDVIGALRVYDRSVEIFFEYREEEKAANLLREILALEPQQLNTLTRLSVVYERSHDDHLLVETLNLLADAAIQKGEKPEALNALRQLLQLEPDEIQHRRRLRDLEGNSDDNDLNEISSHKVKSEMEFWPKGDDEVQPVSFGNTETESDWGVWGNNATDNVVTKNPQEFVSFDEAPSSIETQHSQPAVVESPVSQFDSMPPEASSLKLKDELESVEFYLSQGMLDVARYTLESLSVQFPDSSEVQEKTAQLNAAESEAGSLLLQPEVSSPIKDSFQAWEDAPSTVPVLQSPVQVMELPLPVNPTEWGNNPDILDGKVEYQFSGNGMPLEQEGSIIVLSSESSAVRPPQPMPLVTAEPVNNWVTPQPTAPLTVPQQAIISPALDLFAGEEMGEMLDFLDEFKNESEQEEIVEDFETHYNLGMAYKEMDMFDEAIEEYQQAFKAVMANPMNPSYVACCSMLGYCFSQKGLPRLAVVWLKKGLESPGREEQVYQALRYDLANAYEAMGELQSAYDAFAEVYAMDVQYRSVKIKMQEVSDRLGK